MTSKARAATHARTLATVALFAWAAVAGAIELTPAEAAGKRIFVEGVSASGSTLSARVGVAGTPMPASVVRCANCHGADGRGRPEGGVRPSDITWRRLSAPGGQRSPGGREHPAYDEAAFARAVTQGVDPAENRLDAAMPRFVMSMRDLADLTAYLRRIEDDRDPGLSPDVVRIGTLLPSTGGLAEAGRTVGALLRASFDAANDAGGIHGRRLELVVADPGTDRASAEGALDALARRGDVFALLAPLAPALEGVLGERIDAVGVPAVGALGPYSEAAGSRLLFEPLAGVQEQILALGEFAASDAPIGGVMAVVHPEERASADVARALAERLARRGRPAPLVAAHPPGRFEATALAGALARADARVVVFLGRGDDFAALAEALHAAGRTADLLALASQVGPAALRVPVEYAGRVFLAYPTLPSDWTPEGAAAFEAARRRAGLEARHAALQLRAYTAALVLAEGLKRAGRDASRERLATVLEQMYDFRTGIAPPFGFGPGRRVGAPGAHIVAVDVRKSAFRPTGRYVRIDRAQQ